MKTKTPHWSVAELTQALDLYRNMKAKGQSISEAISEIVKLAAYINRTPAAMSMRLANFKWLDTDGREGLSNGGINLRALWDRNNQ